MLINDYIYFMYNFSDLIIIVFIINSKVLDVLPNSSIIYQMSFVNSCFQ